MKIVVLGLRGFPNIQGGVETHCEQLFTRIAAAGHQVIVLGRKPYMEPALSEYKGVRLVPLACTRGKSLEAFTHTFLGVLKARTLHPDIVHIHAIGPSLMVPMARLLGMKVVSTNHGPDYARAKWGGLAKAVLRIGESMGSRFSNAVIAISEPIASHLRQTYGCAPVVVPNGVVVHVPSQAQDVLLQHGLQPGRYLFAVGRLVPEKGFHDLIDAFAQAGLPGWKLVIAGGADHEDSYSRRLNQKAASVPGVVMTGFISGSPLAQLYSHAGLFVLPSYHEGLPIALLEAMSYGLPVLASDIPANRLAGLPADRFFPPGNLAQATEKIRSLAQRVFTPEEKARQISFIELNFNWDVIMEKTQAVYGKVLKRVSPRGVAHG
jgi:glycosyltransferase involved in cell wall biosynthesis